jgi:hypothetical protein
MRPTVLVFNPEYYWISDSTKASICTLLKLLHLIKLLQILLPLALKPGFRICFLLCNILILFEFGFILEEGVEEVFA